MYTWIHSIRISAAHKKPEKTRPEPLHSLSSPLHLHRGRRLDLVPNAREARHPDNLNRRWLGGSPEDYVADGGEKLFRWFQDFYAAGKNKQ